ncbi:ABC transporter substrate-binding protein [Protaetiibacter intestinalis]|uniref:ABC transporter substrate-binding protein n=1 Tax=Protaetiibacter intestinalis TaxID=2419774 RepID=A0A387B8Y5_9MICO|nr:ABC transporter substrate-binding protein [Protaetiibacter intestinalis]AYF98813.1 ABC transporter substrate-binding protein [Protaetiibacter intestinalis]
MKRIVPGVAALAVATLALAGCSGDPGSDGSGSGDKIVIGGIAGTTGAYGAVGIAVINGTQMAVDEINADGGIAGRQIDFRWDDDAADATKSSQLFQQYVSEGAVAILGSPDTGPTTAALGDQMQIPVLGAVDDGGLTVYPNGPDEPPYAWTFSTSLNTFAWGGKLAEWSIDNCPNGLAMLHDPTTYGLGGLAGFEMVFEETGHDFVYVESITENWGSGATVNLDAEIQKIVDSGASCVEVWLTPGDEAAFMQEIASLGITDLKVLGNDVTNADATFVDLAGPEGDGMISALLTSDVYPDERLSAWQEEYRGLFDGLEPGPFAELSYDAVYILKQVIEDADGDTSPETIRAGLNKLTDFDGLTGKLSFTEQIHTTINKEQLTMVQWNYGSKKWEPME